MTEIDWSKAPEGATHWVQDRSPVDGEEYSGWARFDGKAYLDFNGRHWMPGNPGFNYVPRPPAWNGEGLPPAGTVCEVKFYSGWKQVTVFAHAKGEQGQTDVLFSYARQSGAEDWNWTSEAGKFRPIRTPEQIAAEEREKAVRGMLCVFTAIKDKQAETMIGDLMAALYDAGYRKVEGGEA